MTDKEPAELPSSPVECKHGGEELSRAGIEADKRERSAKTRKNSKARIDPGGQFGYEMFKM